MTWISGYKDDPPFVQKVCSTIIDYADQSKLRHLNIPIFSLNPIRMILDRFINLCSLTFPLASTRSFTSAEIRHLFFTHDQTSVINTHRVKRGDSVGEMDQSHHFANHFLFPALPKTCLHKPCWKIFSLSTGECLRSLTGMISYLWGVVWTSLTGFSFYRSGFNKQSRWRSWGDSGIQRKHGGA